MIEGKELTFIIYLIHQLADSWHMSQAKVYASLVKTGILDDYIVPCYDTLHTLGREYLIEDITELYAEREENQ